MKRKRELRKMDDFSNVLVNASEFIDGRLYFVTLNTDVAPKCTACAHYFAVDTEQCYDNFYNDFGPLNLAMLYHYCIKLDRKLVNPSLHNKKIVHYTGLNDKCRVNAAFLIGSYAIIKLNFDPEDAYKVLTSGSTKDYVDFRDASIGEPYHLSLIDCLRALKKAQNYGFFNFNSFDFFEYEHYERVENGDLNWIVPDKFIAFCGPHNRSTIERGGYPIHSPETYFSYFRRHNVTTIIRLNKKAYDANRFLQAGFDHKDLFFVDGGIPNDRILARFLNICENAKGAIAVHCKAGLGRTGTLIACYIMKHYKFTAEEAIAWIRICRPGSIIAHQQTWLMQKEQSLWADGETYRTRAKMTAPLKHTIGIYSLPVNNNNTSKIKANDNVTGIVRKVDLMEINDKDEDFKSEENSITQGDKLNKIKAQRMKNKLPESTFERRSYRTSMFVSAATTNPTRVKGIISSTTKTTTSRVLTKRNELNESSHTSRRCSQRTKFTATIQQLTKEKKTKSEVQQPQLQLQLQQQKQKQKTPPPVKKKENLSWLLKEEANEKIVKKRGKRTLALEKDKVSPHSVKVLRRSHGQTSKDLNKSDTKLHLPLVKINKSI